MNFMEARLSVSERERSVREDLILGCSSLAGLYADVDEETSQQIVETAIQLGFTMFDTAPHYGCGSGEIRLGKALRRHLPENAWEGIRIYTKVGRVMLPKDVSAGHLDLDSGNVPSNPQCMFKAATEGVLPYFDYSASGIQQSYSDSLRRLDAPRVFGLRVHDCEDAGKLHTVLEDGGLLALVHMREQGLITDVSVGNCDAEFTLRFIRECPPGSIDSVMIGGCWNLLDHDEVGLNILLECQGRGIAVHNAGVFASGVLVGGLSYRYRPAPCDVIERVRRWTMLADKYSVPLPVAALAFAVRPRVVTAVAVGAKHPDEVRQAVQWFGLRDSIPRAFWLEARDEGLLAKHALGDDLVR